ncbi:hypothetical protein [Corynebacterium mastitidis]|uniref:hypothetical protein n=1 Tax=Corynebacterium mastitidis TaxID=161890 RepID=UPI00254D2F80|nr:hypothetical protein [Corynebacterium mastitidis]MDK8450492.1 hypothetical protein [Corynebacterium mastitidis]
MTQTDYYSVDDTRAGRLAQAAFMGAWEGLQDYVPSRPRRLLARTALLAGGLGLVAALNMRDEDPNNDPAALLEEVDLTPAQTWAAFLGGVAALAASSKASGWCRDRIAGMLRRRGVARPYTAWGLAVGAVAFVASEAQARR